MTYKPGESDLERRIALYIKIKKTDHHHYRISGGVPVVHWTRELSVYRVLRVSAWSDPTTHGELTPWLPQPIKYPGWKVHARSRLPANSIIFSGSYNKSILNTVPFWWKSFQFLMRRMKNRLEKMKEKKKKKKWLNNLKFGAFMGPFQVTSWQWKG